jgi:hypothetical protein
VSSSVPRSVHHKQFIELLTSKVQIGNWAASELAIYEYTLNESHKRDWKRMENNLKNVVGKPLVDSADRPIVLN